MSIDFTLSFKDFGIVFIGYKTTVHSRWIHFSRLPFLPEIDALKEDLSIINDTFKHLQISRNDMEKNYVEAYKYAFSRKGK